MQHTHTEIYPLKRSLDTQMNAANHKSEQCFSQVKYKNEKKAIRPGRISNSVYTHVRKMMGAFYSVQSSGNSVRNHIDKGPFRLGPTGIFGNTFESCPLSMEQGWCYSCWGLCNC